MDVLWGGWAGVVVVSAGALAGACATTGAPRHTGMQGEVVWLDRCGTCHQRPDPERFDRAGWVATMTRHRRRARLTDAQWTQLLDFLTYRGGSSGGDLAMGTAVHAP